MNISDVGGGSGGIDNAGFDPLDVLSEADKSSSGGTAGDINIYNTAISQAASEQGPGGIDQTATAGGSMHHHMGGGGGGGNGGGSSGGGGNHHHH